jgi:6-phosphofructokinase 1
LDNTIFAAILSSEEEAAMDKKTFKRTRSEMPYSIAYRVAHELEAATELESRVTVLGYLQRGGTPVPYDRVLATQFGVEAAHMLARGEFGKMVAMKNGELVGVPLDQVAGKIKRVPLDHHLLAAGREVGTCFGD